MKFEFFIILFDGEIMIVLFIIVIWIVLMGLFYGMFDVVNVVFVSFIVNIVGFFTSSFVMTTYCNIIFLVKFFLKSG